MLDRLKEVEKRYEELMVRLCDPSVVSQPELYRDLMKESRYLEPIVEKYRMYAQAVAREAEARLLLETESDAELQELAQEERKEAKRKRHRR